MSDSFEKFTSGEPSSGIANVHVRPAEGIAVNLVYSMGVAVAVLVLPSTSARARLALVHDRHAP